MPILQRKKSLSLPIVTSPRLPIRCEITMLMTFSPMSCVFMLTNSWRINAPTVRSRRVVLMTEQDGSYFPTNFVSKEDLLFTRPDLETKILMLSDADVANIADKVGDALQETYWIAVGVVLANYLGVSQVADTED